MTFGTWKRWLLNGVIVLAIFFTVSTWQSRNLLSLKNQAPSFQLPAISGLNVKLNDFRGKRVLLYFFAPWCKVCDLSISNLNWVKILLGEENVSLLAIALSYKDLQSIKSFVDRNNLEVPVLIGTPNITNSYQINAFPTIYVVNESGRIVSSTVGYTSFLGLWWRTL